MKKVFYLFFLISIISLQAGAQWIAQNSGTNQNLYDIEFLNDRIGWAVGDAGVVIKTTNGGTTWINIPNPSPMYSPNLWSVLPIDSNIVFVTSGKDLIMKSTNGGLNWLIMNFCASCNSSMPGITFLNKDTGWFLGTNKVFRTFNGGVTLDSFYAPWFDNFEIHFKDAYTGVFCGTGRVFKSTDQGESWFDTNVPVGTYFYMFRKLATYGNSVWISGNTSPVYRSTDYCETWETLTPGRQIGGYSISFVNDNTGYVGRSLNNLLKTTDGGYNWYQQRTDPNSQAFISSISFSNDTIGWYSCAIGRIYKTTTGGQWITNVSQIGNEMPHSLGLNQNFPNPFNSQTEILFSIATKGHYTLEIYDTKGNRIQQLLDQFLDPGNYSLNYDAETLSSGVYFYRLSGVQVSSTRKMILLR
jgi:photosystem II stability/assembly factor-like uncharacterized protein